MDCSSHMLPLVVCNALPSVPVFVYDFCESYSSYIYSLNGLVHLTFIYINYILNLFVFCVVLCCIVLNCLVLCCIVLCCVLVSLEIDLNTVTIIW